MPRRMFLLLLVIGAIAVARKATADRGGTYDPTAESAPVGSA